MQLNCNVRRPKYKSAFDQLQIWNNFTEAQTSVHNEMLQEVANTVNRITNIQELYITVVCNDYLKLQVPKILKEHQNEHLKKFRFEACGFFYVAPFGFNWCSEVY